MGNVEYAAAFRELVLPVLSSFNPDLIIIACGLDAAKGDLLGDCGLTADMYYIMTKSLLETAGVDTPMVVALEGGYDLPTISKCMEAVALALLDEPWSEVPMSGDRVLGVTSLMDSNSHHERMQLNQQYTLSRYWKHSYLENDLEKVKDKKSVKRGIVAIKKSAKALARCGKCLSRPHLITGATVGGSHAGASTLQHYQEEYLPPKRDPFVMRNHRPHQEASYPFKKRKFRFSNDFETGAAPMMAFATY
jgi:hypothetical protein